MSEKPDKKSPAPPAPSVMPTTEILIVGVVGLIMLPIVWVYVSSAWESGLSDVVLTWFMRIKILLTIVSMVALVIAVYAFMRLTEITKDENDKLNVALSWEHERVEKNHRWERIEEQMSSSNPSDWRVAILEADSILDEILERMGYRGETLGERLKGLKQSDFSHLDEVWKAHKTRNDIAHKGAVDFVLSRSLAETTIDTYHRVFKGLGYL
jgi:uncharacterized membrane protein